MQLQFTCTEIKEAIAPKLKFGTTKSLALRGFLLLKNQRTISKS